MRAIIVQVEMLTTSSREGQRSTYSRMSWVQWSRGSHNRCDRDGTCIELLYVRRNQSREGESRHPYACRISRFDGFWDSSTQGW